MNNINSIINLKKYPINNKIFIKNCKIDLQNKSVLILKNFLKRDALKNILIEAHKLEDKAFYCNQKHTILLTKKNSKKDKLDPLNINVIWSDPPRNMICIEPWTSPRRSLITGERKLVINSGDVFPLSCEFVVI